MRKTTSVAHLGIIQITASIVNIRIAPFVGNGIKRNTSFGMISRTFAVNSSANVGTAARLFARTR
jgi:hypothetical protein